MNHEQIIRAWKDSSYRTSLSAEELSQMPANPAGEILSEVELNSVTGGDSSYLVYAKNTGDVCVNYNVAKSGTVINNSYFNFGNNGSFYYAPDCSTNTDSFNTTTGDN